MNFATNLLDFWWCNRLKLKIITVGKLKEDFLKKGVDHYIKKIRKSFELELVEIPDEKTPESRSLKEEEKIKDVEGEKILSKLNSDDYLITLEIGGKKLDTESFKKTVRGLAETEKSLAFVIGGSLGISSKVSRQSSCKLSFSDMTFPHQLMKLILLEQLSRID